MVGVWKGVTMSDQATVGVGSTVRVTVGDDVIEAGATGVVLHVYADGNLRVSFGTQVHAGEVQFLRWTVPAGAYEVVPEVDPVWVDTGIPITD